MRKRTDNPQSEVCREALGGLDQEVADDKKQELIDQVTWSLRVLEESHSGRQSNEYIKTGECTW
jgi:hypothetical protein